MQKIEADELLEKLKSGEIDADQIYNLDLDMDQYAAIKHYINYPEDNINKQQILKVLPFDIEVYHYNKDIEIQEDLKTGGSPITAVTIYDDTKKIYHTFFLLLKHVSHLIGKEMVNDIRVSAKERLIKEKYLEEDQNIEIHLYYNTELRMLEDLWLTIHQIDPAIITSFNGDNYDLPILYKRLENLTGDEKKVWEILSKFKVVKKRKMEDGKFFYFIPEYPLLDTRRLYIPRAEGGLNYGKAQPNYTLDWISQQELKLKKLDFKEEGMSLDKLYDTDPITYMIYNLVDVILVQKLKEKLGHIDLHNLLRRDMKTPMNTSLRGQSGFFDTFLSYELERNGIVMRYGMGSESILNISETEIAEIPKPKDKKTDWDVSSVTTKEYSAVLNRFPGAYVKSGYGAIVDSGKGILIDMDASLPPWEKIFIRRQGKIYWGEIGYYQFQKGDETLSWDQNNQTCWKSVLGKTEHEWNNGELIEITTETGKKTTVTNNHSIFGIHQNIITNQVNQIDASTLRVGDYVVGIKQFETNGTKTSKNPETIGFWLSDGWANSKTSQYYIAKQDKELLEIFDPFIARIRKKRNDDGQYKEEWIGNVEEPIRTELENFYTHTTRKNFLEILNYTRDQRRKIWEGMMFADGTLHGLNQDDVITPTERLCKYCPEEKDECFIVAHTIGWKPKNRTNGIDNTPTKIDDSNRYGLDQVCPEVFKSVKGACYKLQQNNMSHNHRHSLNKIKHILPHVTQIYTETMGLEKIEELKRYNYKGKVYDISVQDTERFFCGTGIGAHNTSLYPSTMLQYNISFDAYYGYVIDPVCYNTLHHISTVLGTNNNYVDSLHNSVFEFVNKYVEELAPQNKNNYKQIMYYMIMNLFIKLKKINIPLQSLMTPQNQDDYLILKCYLIPLLELLVEIHPKGEEYNTFCHDYLLNGEIQSELKNLFIVTDANNPTVKIIWIKPNEIQEFLTKNNLCMNISGALFYTHSYKLGTVYKFLTERLDMRKEYKNKRDTFKKGSEEYKFYNHRQNVMKTNANSSYGLTGMSGFRFSNKWLAKSTTISGRLALKIAQSCGEMYLDEYTKQTK